MIEEKKEWYEEWFDSKYYHLLYSDRDEEEAAAFISLLLETFPPKENGVVLDLACGKGRHSKQIAALGHKVHGVDLSPESIADCKQYETDDLKFAIHDMREVYQAGTFDLVVNLFTSFGYFDDIKDNILVLEAIGKELTDNGRFVIDFLNVIPVLDQLPQKHIGSQHFTEKVQALVLADFQEMVAKAGLSIDKIYGDYQLNEYSAGDSPRLIITGSKH